MPSGAELVHAAQAYIGVPYLFGGKTAAAGLDCSGLISLACRDVGVPLVDGSSAQIAACEAVDVEDAWNIPGAMLWRKGHNALALGDGAHTIEATSTPRDGVHSYGRTDRFTKAGLIPGIDYGRTTVARAWVNPAVGNIEPLKDPSTGKAAKGYGPRAPIKLAGGGQTLPFHAGVDISNVTGTEVRAAGDGYVTYAGWAGTGVTIGRTGIAIVVAHTDGSATYYGHLDSLDVTLGQRVSAGQRIGRMGKTGNVTGPHLHFECRPNAKHTTTQDPISWARARGITLGAPTYTPEYVRTVQQLLNRVTGAGLEVDGALATKTTAAVKAFQASAGLVDDGDPGSRTLTALRAAAERTDTEQQEDDMPRFIRAKDTPRIYAYNGVTKRHVATTTALKEEQALLGETRIYDVSAATLAQIPDATIPPATLKALVVEALQAAPGGLDLEDLAQAVVGRIGRQLAGL